MKHSFWANPVGFRDPLQTDKLRLKKPQLEKFLNRDLEENLKKYGILSCGFSVFLNFSESCGKTLQRYGDVGKNSPLSRRSR
jgi:hypothetical protein